MRKAREGACDTKKPGGGRRVSSGKTGAITRQPPTLPHLVPLRAHNPAVRRSASYEAYRVKGGARRLDRLQTMSGSASRSTVEQVHITSYPVGSPGACTHIPHARASLRGEEDRTHLYDGIKAPGTTGPYPSRFVAGDGGRLSRRTQGYALITAPSGMSPCVTYRHRAIISLRARATIIVRRMRPLLAPTRS
jgi:hypothetical protein